MLLKTGFVLGLAPKTVWLLVDVFDLAIIKKVNAVKSTALVTNIYELLSVIPLVA